MNNRPIALITGITGQDGSYLAELLLRKNYEVHGIIRRSSTFNTGRIDHLYQDPHMPDRSLFLHYGDLSNGEEITNVIHTVQPDEVYHLAAQSHVAVSFDSPGYTGAITGLGTTTILEALRRSDKKARFYQASSSEMFGSASAPQSETTPFQPQSPYAVAKLYAYWMTRNYREGYGLHASNGILFNHESPRRGQTFVTRKITVAIANILAGKQDKLFLGNLDAKRDWGYSPEYVDVMWRALQQPEADDYVVGTGQSNTVREFLELAFSYANLDWNKYVEIDQRYVRPLEVNHLQADNRKAVSKLGWSPKIRIAELAKIMVDSDMELIGLDPIGEGNEIAKSVAQN